MHNRKPAPLTVWLAVVFIAISFCAVGVSFSIQKYQLLEKISQNFYSKNAIFFAVRGADLEHYRLFIEAMREDDVFYKSVQGNVRGIRAGAKPNSFPLIQGRFYTTDDWQTDTKRALIGQSLIEHTIESEGKTEYRFGDQIFEVIGVLGIDIPSRLDQMILLNLDAILPLTGMDGQWALDGSKLVDETYRRIEVAATLHGFEIQRLDQPLEGTRRFFRNENLYIPLYIGVFFCLVGCAATVTYAWIESRRNLIAIQKLCGYSSSEVFVDSCKPYIAAIAVGYSTGFLLGLFLWSDPYIRLPDMFPSALSISAAAWLACVIPLIVLMGSWTDRMVRRVSH